MENIQNTINSETLSQPTQPPIIPPIPQKKPYMILFLIFLGLFLITISVLITFLITKNKPASKLTEATTPTIIPTNISTNIPTQAADETADWKTYSDQTSGVSFKYPNDIVLITKDDTTIQKPTLKVNINKISELGKIASGDEDFENHLRQDKEALGKGQIVNVTGPYDLSNGWEITKINNINAKKSTTLILMEVCSVLLDRRLVFYINDYRVDISYNYKNGINFIPDKYLTADQENCGSSKKWKDVDSFRETINSNKLENQYLQNWYNNFDKIISTIKFN